MRSMHDHDLVNDVTLVPGYETYAHRKVWGVMCQVDFIGGSINTDTLDEYVKEVLEAVFEAQKISEST